MTRELQADSHSVLAGDLVERMASAVHDVFCQGMRDLGYAYGPTTDAVRKTHPALRPYRELSEDLKEQNRGTVRDIGGKLSVLDYIMVPTCGDSPVFEFLDRDLELLAKMEHERWMAAKLAAGWRYGRETDSLRKRHESLVPWADLPESEREKDRIIVRQIPAILTRAGYTVEKLREDAASA